MFSEGDELYDKRFGERYLVLGPTATYMFRTLHRSMRKS